MQNPIDLHYKALEHTLNYVATTSGHGILLKDSDSLKLKAYSDSNWSVCLDIRHYLRNKVKSLSLLQMQNIAQRRQLLLKSHGWLTYLKNLVLQTLRLFHQNVIIKQPYIQPKFQCFTIAPNTSTQVVTSPEKKCCLIELCVSGYLPTSQLATF